MYTMSRTSMMFPLLVIIMFPFCSFTIDGSTEPLNTTVGHYSYMLHTRTVRETRPLIGPFDLSRKIKKIKQSVTRQPSAAPHHAASILGQNKYKNNQNIFSSAALVTDSDVLNTSTAPATRKLADKTRSPRNNNKIDSSTIPPSSNGDSKSSKRPKKRKTKIGLSASAEQTAVHWPARAVVLPGDLVLGGLITVHGRGTGSWACGALRALGVQTLEVMLYALETAGPPAPGMRLGALLLDDCDTDTRGLEMALDLIKGSIGNIDADRRACNASVSTGVPGAPGTLSAVDPGERQVISGVVGAASSVTSVQVANLLRLFKIPQVSFFSTSPELSNKARFEYFTRTIPSDSHQVRAMVEIMKQLEWRYVSVVYEESNYGIKAFEELETMLARSNICIAVKERLVRELGEPHDDTYDGLVKRLLARPRARGVVVFACEREVAGLMAAVRRRGADGVFSWLGSDCWAGGALVTAGSERSVAGAIGVQLQDKPVRGFREYFLNLTVKNNPRNPWFEIISDLEFWEEKFGCRYPGAGRTSLGSSTVRGAGAERYCTGAERLSIDTPLEGRLHLVADAVFAFVYAVRDMHRALCGGRPGLCAKMRPPSGPLLLRYLRRVRFTGLSGEEFYFDVNGDGPARYDILYYRREARGGYHWLKIGKYLGGDLHLDIDEIQSRAASVCSAECAPGQARRYAAGDSCCWHCYNCSQYEIRSPGSESACAQCPLGTLPDTARARCLPVPALALRPTHPALAAALACSALGALLTAAVGALWALRGDTPVVRASGRELSLVLLAGILLCYLLPFALVLRPTDRVCALQRFGSALCFTVVYAALLTKTNRIARIFSAPRRSARRPPLISPRSQLAICALLVSVQVAVVSVWQAAAPARAVHHFPTRAQNLLVCECYVDASYALAFLYPALLVGVCTVHAVLTRNLPEAFNESKHIGFAMYTTCVIWFAFVPLHLGTASRVPLRVTSLALIISLSASVTLACLFAPKVYVILVRPERNVRASLMPARWRARGAAGAAGAAGGAVCAALVGAAPLPGTASPPPPRDTSTVFSTSEVSGGRSTSTERQVQTEETRLERTGGVLRLDPRRLAGLAAGLPAFAPAPGALRRRGVRDATLL